MLKHQSNEQISIRLRNMTLENGETGAYAHLISLTIVFCSMLLTDSLKAWTWALLGLIK
jgi:hypothetical protein